MIASAGGVVHALLTHLWSVQGRADGTRRRLDVGPGRPSSTCIEWTSLMAVRPGHGSPGR